MIPETMLEDYSLPFAFGHLVVNQPPDRKRDAAEDQQRTKWLEDQSNQPRVHRAIVAGELPHDSCPVVANGGEVIRGYSVFNRQSHIAARVLADRFNLLRRKAAGVVLFSVPESALVSRVKSVVLLLCRGEVPRIYARRIVAGVHQHKTIGDRSAKDRIAVAVRKNVPPIQRHDSISGLGFSRSPNPASFSFLDSVHEGLFGTHWRKLFQLPAISGAVVAVFAQLSAVARFPALQARWLDSLVSHIASYVCDYNRKQGVMQ